MLPKSLISIRNRPSKGGYVCPESEFQNLSFLVSRWRRPCHCQDFTIVFVLLFSVAVAVLFKPIVVSFVSISALPMSLFQGHFASVSKFSLTAPEESSQNRCNQRRVT